MTDKELDKIKSFTERVHKQAIESDLTTYDEDVIRLCHVVTVLNRCLEKCIEQRNSLLKENLVRQYGTELKSKTVKDVTKVFDASIKEIIKPKPMTEKRRL